MEKYFTCVIVCFIFTNLSSYFCVIGTGNIDLPTVSTKNVTAHYCPFPCTVGNETLCIPPPCPPPACVDPARYKPTDCCVYCPHGPNCRGPDESVIPWNHWKIVDGKNCTCKYLGQDATCV